MVMTGLDALLERAAAGEPLGDTDRRTLFDTRDVLALGMAAEQARRRRHGARITFVRVATLALDAAKADWPPAAGEVRLEGELRDVAAATAAIRLVADRAAGRVPVTGFSLAQIEQAARGDPAAAESMLKSFAGAGLRAIAEAPLDALQSAESMLAAAAAAGVAVLRLTVEQSPVESRYQHLARAAALARTAAFEAFAPLPGRTSSATPTTGFEDVRLIALARLLVDVRRIQVDWSKYGPKLAQVGLTFGADDVDAVSPLEGTGEGRRRAPLEEIRRNITAAGGEPIERDGLFRPRG